MARILRQHVTKTLTSNYLQTSWPSYNDGTSSGQYNEGITLSDFFKTRLLQKIIFLCLSDSHLDSYHFKCILRSKPNPNPFEIASKVGVKFLPIFWEINIFIYYIYI